jgi:hypothetical protein
MIDALATTATVTVSWADTAVHFVRGDSRKANEVSIRLRDPSGRLLHPDASQVQRIAGDGFVVFRLHDPVPGLWHVETSTVNDQRRLPYTVGCFCTSPVRL